MFDGMSDDEDEFQSVSECISATHTHKHHPVQNLHLYQHLSPRPEPFHHRPCPPGPVRSLSNTHTPVSPPQGNQAGPSSRGGAPAGVRPQSLSHSGAAGPRPITQSELATALALASTPDSSAATPTTASQVRPAGAPAGTELDSRHRKVFAGFDARRRRRPW